MRRQHVHDDTQCRMDATRRVIVASGDPPDSDQASFAGTVFLVMVCKQHDLDPRHSAPLPKPSHVGADRTTLEALGQAAR